MKSTHTRGTFIMTSLQFPILCVLLYVFVAQSMSDPMPAIGPLFAAIPLLSFPMMFFLRRSLKGPNPHTTAALIGYAVAELGVLLAMFVGNSRIGGLVAMAVAIPVMIAILVYTLYTWPE